MENPPAARKIAEQVLINKRSRERGEKARLNHQEEACPARWTSPTGCRSLWTAAPKDGPPGSCTSWRGLRPGLGEAGPGRGVPGHHARPGKILNCLKADYAKIFKSEIITDLLKGHGLRGGGPGQARKDLSLFNLDNLRWNKIVICTDADVDGFQIRTLILTMLWRLTPHPDPGGAMSTYRRVPPL